MRIPVLCPSCGASFTVDEKFAGQVGPCPKCKTPIPVPTLAEIMAAGGAAPKPSSAAAAPTTKKPDAAGAPAAAAGGRLMPPGKTAPSASAPAATRAPASGATTASSAGAATGSPAAPNRSGPAAPAGPARSSPAAKSGKETPKDLSPAAQVAAKLDNRSLIRDAKKPAAPAPVDAKPRTGPQQVGLGTGRQAPITDEVIIHEPDAYQQGGVDKKGRPILKPISRVEAKFRPVQLVLTLVATLVVLGVDWYLGKMFAGKPLAHIVVWLIIAGSSVPLALGAYWVLAPSEAEPYTGSQLWIRTGACAAVYSLLWIARYFIPAEWTAEYYYWAMVAPPFFVVGAATAFLAFDLEGENTLFHFGLFVVASVLLRGVAGLPWV